MSKLDKLLSGLDKVKRTGKDSFIACCPAHDDRSPSMTIREIEPDHILMHCFAGCDTQSILAAIGLSFNDVHPDRARDDLRRPSQIPFNARDVLAALHSESTKVLIYAKDVQRGKALTDAESLELAKSVGRIGAACEIARAGL